MRKTGRVRGGNEVCPQGTYTWLAYVRDKSGLLHKYIGSVTLIK